MALFVFLLMLYVSQSGAVRVKVYEGKESVSLPFIIRPLNMDMDPSALWTREGSSTETVHIRVMKGDDLRSQSPQFKGRTEMKNDSLKTGDLSLTLTHPTVSDSGVYTCEVREGITVVERTSVQLIVIGKQVTAVEGVESVSLPFIMTPLNISKDPSALWTREGSQVHRRVKEIDDLRLQSAQFKGRTQMNERALQTGDLSLVLKKPTLKDSGIYTCTATEGRTETGRVSVEVNIVPPPPPIPPPSPGPIIAAAFVSLVLVGLGALVCGVWYNRKKRMSIKLLVCDGAKSVSLPFKLKRGLNMKKDPSALWSREGSSPEEVHLRLKERNDFCTQSPRFRGRTEMKPDSLQTGDLSLVLRHPTASDSGTYTCVVRESITVVRRTSVQLIVIRSIGVTLEVCEGRQSVSLPCNMNDDPDKKIDSPALWTRERSTSEIVHLIDEEGDNLRNQSPQFEGRTEMKESALETGDLSLTLRHPTVSDSGVYTCEVKDGTDVARTSVELIVKKNWKYGTLPRPQRNKRVAKLRSKSCSAGTPPRGEVF